MGPGPKGTGERRKVHRYDNKALTHVLLGVSNALFHSHWFFGGSRMVGEKLKVMELESASTQKYANSTQFQGLREPLKHHLRSVIELLSFGFRYLAHSAYNLSFVVAVSLRSSSSRKNNRTANQPLPNNWRFQFLFYLLLACETIRGSRQFHEFD